MRLLGSYGKNKRPEVVEVSSLEEFVNDMNSQHCAFLFRIRQDMGVPAIEVLNPSGELVGLFLRYADTDPDPRTWQSGPN